MAEFAGPVVEDVFPMTSASAIPRPTLTEGSKSPFVPTQEMKNESQGKREGVRKRERR